MKITEIRVKLMQNGAARRDKLKAFCSITFDNEFVVRDLKIIEGSRGLFIAMPSRKLMVRCPSCGGKNAVRSRYCSECGTKQVDRVSKNDETSPSRRLYADIAHPIHAGARDKLHSSIVSAYEKELEASKREGYKPPRFDDLDYDMLHDESGAKSRRPSHRDHGRENGAEAETLHHRPRHVAGGPGPRSASGKQDDDEGARELGASG